MHKKLGIIRSLINRQMLFLVIEAWGMALQWSFAPRWGSIDFSSNACRTKIGGRSNLIKPLKVF